MAGDRYSNSNTLAEEAIENTELTVLKPDIDLKDLGVGKFDPDDLTFSGLTADKNNTLGKSDLASIPTGLVYEPLDKKELKDFEPLLNPSDLKDFDVGGVITSKNLDGSTDSLLLDTDINKPDDIFKDYFPNQKRAALPKDLGKSPLIIDEIDSVYGEFELPSSLQKSDSLLNPANSKTKPTSKQLPWTPNSWTPNSWKSVLSEPAWKNLVDSSNLTANKNKTQTSKQSPKTTKQNSLNSNLFPARQHLCVFDEQYYLAENPDVAKLKIEPLTHYLFIGKSQGLSPSALCEYTNLDSDLTGLERNSWGLNNSNFDRSPTTDL